MSEEIKRTRSPNSPKITLEAAISLAKQLHAKIGRSRVKAEVAVGAIGYNGLNGASQTTLGALSSYGLIDRTEGDVQISTLAIKILHPIDEGSLANSLRQAALSPRVFSEIFENYGDMDEEMLSNTLIHRDFTPDRAKLVAGVFKANYLLSKLSQKGNTVANNPIEPKTFQAHQDQIHDHISLSDKYDAEVVRADSRPKMLASYKIPLGMSEAELIFTGKNLSVEDFDALLDYVQLFKRQYERKELLSNNLTPANTQHTEEKP